MRVIFPDSQKCACSEKIEKAMVERFKFKLIWFKYKWFELGQGLGVAKMLRFLVGLRNMIKEYMSRLETKLEAEKEQNYFASVFMGDSKFLEYNFVAP